MAIELQLFTNNGTTALDGAITNSATTINVTDGTVFGSPSANEYQLLTIDDGTNIEIVKLTSRTVDALTVVRAQEGTSGTAFASGITIEGRATKGTFERLAQNVATGTDSVVIGPDNIDATGHPDCVVIGSGCTVAEQDNVIIGRNCSASSTNGVAIGEAAWINASCNDAVSVGAGATCYGPASVSIGDGATSTGSTGYSAIAIGHSANAAADGTIAIGENAHADSANGISIGNETDVNGADSIAIGTYYLQARRADCFHHSGIASVGHNAFTYDPLKHGCSEEAIIWTDEVDMTGGISDDVAVITIPTGIKFFINEIGFMSTEYDTVGTWPQIKVGETTGAADVVAASHTISSAVIDAAYTRDVTATILTPNTAKVALYVSITVNGAATALVGRFYFKGIAIDQQAA